MKHFEIYKKDPATGALYPEGQRRKKGLARILEIVVRDFWQLLGSGLIATAAALPYGLCIMLFLPSSALGPLILSCVVTGALASVFGMNLLDTILRCLRDEAGFWSFQYKKSLKNNTLLRSAPVQGGYVMWQTDITELVENMERLKENRTELAERNYLEQQNYEVERKINALREKNRLYDLLQRQLAPQIIRMDQLLTRYRAAPEEEKRQLLGQVAVLGAYLKRGANLMFLAQQHRYVPSAELRYALEESISSLELAGVECAMEVTHEARLPAEAAAACYSRFESVVEGALGQLDALFVRAIWKDHRLNLYLSVETGADLKAACPAAVQEAPGSWVLNDHFEGGAPECGTN